jgi:hypothetical protein
MTGYRRIVLGLAIAMPLAVAGSCAFAFTYSDGPPGYSTGDTFIDPDSRFGAMSDQLNQMYGADTTDYSEMLTNQPAGSPAPAVTLVPRSPTNIGGNR